MAKNVLVIKHGALGDFVLAAGVMKSLREKHIGDKITIMTTQKYKDFAVMTGFFDDVIIDNRPHYSPSNWYRVCKQVLAEGGWDIIYDLQLSNRTNRYYNISRFLTDKPVTWAIWQKAKGHQGFLLKEVPAKPKYTLIKPKETFQAWDFAVSDLSFCKGEQEHFNLLPTSYVLIMPGCSAGNTYKRWPADKFAALVKRLGDDGTASVVLGTKAEENEVNMIAAASNCAVNFLNKASVMDIPALAARARAVIGNDSGPTHMAAFTGTKTLFLFCQKTAFAAPDLPNVTNIIKPLTDDITVDEVYATVQQMLSSQT